MNPKEFKFEFLPNEIFFEIFRYFDAKELFQCFYNLNSRFNNLLQSINNLSLSLNVSHSNRIHHYDHFAPCVCTLIIIGKVQIDLNSFTNIRHLILFQPISELIKQIEINSLPYLEYLYIRLGNRIEDDCNQIILNDFPNLKTCRIYKSGLLTINSSWIQMPRLTVLKLGDIDSIIYKSILSSCSNLYFLQFTRIITNSQPSDIIQHRNLKKITIIIPWFEELYEDTDMNYYLSCIPNLEQLTIHRTNESNSINESYLKHDWHESIVKNCLTLLSCFTYYFHILKSSRMNPFLMEKIFNQIQGRFYHLYRHLNQSRFIIDI